MNEPNSNNTVIVISHLGLCINKVLLQVASQSLARLQDDQIVNVLVPWAHSSTQSSSTELNSLSEQAVQLLESTGFQELFDNGARARVGVPMNIISCCTHQARLIFS